MNNLRLLAYWENRNNGQAHCQQFGYKLTGENRDELVCLGRDHPRLLSACRIDDTASEATIREVFEICGIFANVGPALRSYNQYEIRDGLFWLEEYRHSHMTVHRGELLPVGTWRWKINVHHKAILRLKRQHERKAGRVADSAIVVG